MNHDEIKDLVNEASKVAFEKQQPYFKKLAKKSVNDLKIHDETDLSTIIAKVFQLSELLAIEVGSRLANQTLTEVLDQLDVKKKDS